MLFGNPGGPLFHIVSPTPTDDDVAYSLLLNTDLRVADITNHISCGQIVRNALFTIYIQFRPNCSVQGSPSDRVNGERDGDSGREPGTKDEGVDVDASTVRSQAKPSDGITSWNSITRDAVLANLFAGLRLFPSAER